ncbi:MAG: xanthine dehydrogenase family protein subunit M [Gammaproteobacteria bacterium]|nr:xanthine dehydrogenase family protein subunit M [Gammaproteobacteria bacterium]MBU0786286.1 xanthine dehydrogenase family protein subunit M [Gammaproteobacteria bacterium]MBU0814494.1 xanthine dehydrogenase family protein subunit M [Gammaproteobacteria bacterium]MBU1786663.1 xanthine dehydrogenase family protein subunit M [Gammaproteobacteria bacterium]
MIPPAFDYHAPVSVGEAISLLSSLGDDAKILAGGHSLLPMMKLRFAQPGTLIDINRIPELRGITEEGGKIRIGAMTTESELIDSQLLQDRLPLLPEAAQLIADPQVRNRGTIGGDIAHGDPGNDHPAIAMALDAEFVLQGPKGERTVKAVDFFHGTYMTALAEDEILTAILIAPFAAGTGSAYQKLKRKTGDWATAGAAVVLRMSGGKVTHASIGLTNVAPTALRAREAEAALIGKVLDDATLDAAVKAVRTVCDPAEDLRGDAEYKTAMAGEMTKRAIRAAAARCK